MQLTRAGVTTIASSTPNKQMITCPLLLIHVVRAAVLHFNDVIQIKAAVVYTETDLTCHQSFSDCRVCTIKLTWTLSTAAITENTFVRHPIPGSSLETIPTRYQATIVSVMRRFCVPLSAVCFAQDCVICATIHFK